MWAAIKCRCASVAFTLCMMPLVGITATQTFATTAEDAISVVVDQATLIKLPERAQTIVVGNPLIADVALQAGGMVVVTGKGYGATNVIAMDRNGDILLDRIIQVEGPTDLKLVTVYRGASRESYSCTPVCQKRVTLGDEKDFFAGALEQAGVLSSHASGSK